MSLLKNPGVTPDFEAMNDAAETLGVELSDMSSPKAIVGDLRQHFAARLEGKAEDDHVQCPKCGEVTDDDPRIEVCPFCGDEGADEDEADAMEADDEDEAEEPGAVDGDELDPGEEPEEPEAVDLATAGDEPEPELEDPGIEPEKEEPITAEFRKKELLKMGKAELVNIAASRGLELKGTKSMLADRILEAEAMAPDPGIEPEESPKVEAPKEAKSLAKALATEDEKVSKAQHDMMNSSYDLGVALRAIHEGELWKAGGHKTFAKYLASKGIGRTFAYDLMSLVEKFDRETFDEVGRKKLMLVARAGGPETAEGKKALDKAKGGASVRELEGKKSKPKKSETPKSAAPELPPKTDRITVLGNLGAKPKTIPFVDRKTRKPVKAWTPESFAEIELSEDVSLFLALKTDKETGQIVGVTVAARRAVKPEAAE